jgi:protein TonB
VAVEPVVPPRPLPTLTAPVVTPNALTMQSTGKASISAPPIGGGGRGNGQGEGQGSGLDKGIGGGTGDGVYAPGSGVIDPRVLREVPPKYTSEAMRAKIQGVVRVQVLINEDGTVDPNVRVEKSLDAVNGLDQEAMKAARAWLFQPATLRSTGKPVKYRASLELAFRIF